MVGLTKAHMDCIQGWVPLQGLQLLIARFLSASC